MEPGALKQGVEFQRLALVVDDGREGFAVVFRHVQRRQKCREIDEVVCRPRWRRQASLVIFLRRSRTFAIRPLTVSISVIGFFPH